MLPRPPCRAAPARPPTHTPTHAHARACGNGMTVMLRSAFLESGTNDRFDELKQPLTCYVRKTFRKADGESSDSKA